MNPLLLMALGTLLVFLIMTALWLLGIRNRNFSYVDIGWSGNFALLGIAVRRRSRRGGKRASGSSPRCMRCGRCASPDTWPNVSSASLRKAATWSCGNAGPPICNAMFFGFFQLQAVLNVVLAVPLLIACLNPEPSLHVLEAAGVAIWLVGLIGESIADGQLAAFKRHPHPIGAESAM